MSSDRWLEFVDIACHQLIRIHWANPALHLERIECCTSLVRLSLRYALHYPKIIPVIFLLVLQLAADVLCFHNQMIRPNLSMLSLDDEWICAVIWTRIFFCWIYILETIRHSSINYTSNIFRIWSNYLNPINCSVGAVPLCTCVVSVFALSSSHHSGNASRKLVKPSEKWNAHK